MMIIIFGNGGRMKKQIIVGCLTLYCFFILTFTVAANVAPTIDTDSIAWKIAAGLCSILLAGVGAILLKIDKNQTKLFELHSDVNNRLIEVETGIEYCDACNSHRHRRSSDKN
jgi:hypothetical protein